MEYTQQDDSEDGVRYVEYISMMGMATVEGRQWWRRRHRWKHIYYKQKILFSMNEVAATFLKNEIVSKDDNVEGNQQ